MSDVPVWHLYAYMTGDELGEQDEIRRVTDWQLEDALRWCRFRGFDHIYLYRDEQETARFQRTAPTGVRHHMRLVDGPDAA